MNNLSFFFDIQPGPPDPDRAAQALHRAWTKRRVPAGVPNFATMASPGEIRGHVGCTEMSCRKGGQSDFIRSL